MEKIKSSASIASNHAYGFELSENEEGEPVVKVTNPWNTSFFNKNKVKSLPLSKFLKYFDAIYIAETHSDDF